MAGALPIRSHARADPAPDLRRLYDEHAGYLRTFLAGLLGPGCDPDDVVQEVFVIVWRKLARTRPQQVLPWMCQIAVRRAAAWRRRSYWRRWLQLDPAKEEMEWQTPEANAEEHESTRIAYGILEAMSEKRRTVFILYELQGLTGQQIAELLGCPLKTVHTRLFHARREFLARNEALAARESAPGGKP